MRLVHLLFIVIVSSPGVAFSTDPSDHLTDKQLTIHTLVREDIFAGWRADNMDRFERGEQNVQKLLELRPDSRADLLAWRGGTELYRAVLAHESKEESKFRQHMQASKAAFAEAKKLGPDSNGVASVVGGSNAMFADRLPTEYRKAAWNSSYEGYQMLWRKQQSFVEKMPTHIRGELLAGLAQSSQRTGRNEELATYLDMILKVLPNTPYAKVAQRWKDKPQAAVTGNITCKTCHRPGRLTDRLAANTAE